MPERRVFRSVSGSFPMISDTSAPAHVQSWTMSLVASPVASASSSVWAAARAMAGVTRDSSSLYSLAARMASRSTSVRVAVALDCLSAVCAASRRMRTMDSMFFSSPTSASACS